jgi:hypothetical protein
MAAKQEDAYTRNGYKDRSDYLDSLADDRGLDLFAVSMIADMLGPDEDFDGLVSELEDMAYSGAYDAFVKEERENEKAEH